MAVPDDEEDVSLSKREALWISEETAGKAVTVWAVDGTEHRISRQDKTVCLK
jgi:hypothetical protein